MPQNEHLSEINILEELMPEERKEAYVQFLKEACRNRQINTIYVTFPVKCDDPLGWFHHHSSSYSTQFYWEIPARSSAIATLGCSRELFFEGTKRFHLLENALQKAGSEIATFNLFKS